jgi:hypothetical protein
MAKEEEAEILLEDRPDETPDGKAVFKLEEAVGNKADSKLEPDGAEEAPPRGRESPKRPESAFEVWAAFAGCDVVAAAAALVA